MLASLADGVELCCKQVGFDLHLHELVCTSHSVPLL